MKTLKIIINKYFHLNYLELGLLNISLELMFVYLNLGIKTYFLYELKNKKYKRLSKSIIVPAKNEEGNLEELISRIPKFDEDYEILISCGPSKDKTFEKAKSIQDINNLEYSNF